MNDNTFWSSYNDVVSLLKSIGFLKETVSHKYYGYSQKSIECSRSDYKTRYQSLIDNIDYDILLYDDSILQMNIRNGECRLLYIQVPTYYVTFEEYMVAVDLCGYDKSDAYRLFSDDYAQFLIEQSINSGAVYMRYDVSENERKENIHAYTHLHIGIDNNIRIPVGMHLTPLAFVLFVIRHVYYDKWKSLMKEKEYVKKYLNFKDGCESLPSELWSEEEKKSLYLC